MQAVEVDDAVARIARSINEHPAQGFLPDESVEGLDVLYHALVFAEAAEALSIWRTALWDRTLTAEGRAAVTRMLDFLNGEVQAGRGEAVSAVCDCLTAIFSTGPSRERDQVASAGKR